MMNKKRILKFGIVVLALVGGAIFLAKEAVAEESEMQLGENQRYVYAYISEIEGNEITYAVFEESVVTEMGEMPERGQNSPQEDRMTGTEQITTLIPVGTRVHTQADTVTTFQRLATGDMIKMIIETTEDGEEVITEIWMM